MMTVGDLILKVKADEQAREDALLAVQQANASLESATTDVADDESRLGQVLAVVGTIFIVEADGTASIYAPDGSGSYHVTVAKPADTDVGV